MRGLKLADNTLNAITKEVAPYMGAWIETPLLLNRLLPFLVAPYMGAWIETRNRLTAAP